MRKALVKYYFCMATNISPVAENEGKPSIELKVEDIEELPINETKERRKLKISEWWNRLKLTGGKTSKLHGGFSLIQNNSITLRNVVVAASTYGLERLLNAEVFHCPEKNFHQYGFTFLLAPLVVLFCVNLLVIGEIWNLSSRIYIKRYRRRGDCFTRVLLSLLKACVAPAVWLIVAFLDEDYYVCAKLGPLRNRGTSAQRVAEYRSQSQIYAWMVLISIVLIGSVFVVWKNCYLKDNLLMENLYSYERREALSAKKAFTELMGSKCEDANLDNDPMTGEYGIEEEKVTLYHNGIPEMIGKKTAEKLFEGYKGEHWTESDGWHYIHAYNAFKEIFPRISTGSPRDPWRIEDPGTDRQDTTKNSRAKWAITNIFKTGESLDVRESKV
ncbi:uncharacterized protein [Montipora foliosa]|uniref:uncharacterized protein n=1 Tax=Montipora foliosa TaxID=591990 RepID=UPI0035F1582A